MCHNEEGGRERERGGTDLQRCDFPILLMIESNGFVGLKESIEIVDDTIDAVCNMHVPQLRPQEVVFV